MSYENIKLILFKVFRFPIAIPLAILFFYNFGQFALVPYLGYLSETYPELITASLVGLALSAKSIAEKFGLFGFSIFNLSYSSKYTLSIGLFLRALAFLILQFVLNEPALFISIILVGFAGSLIRPTVRAILNNQTNSENKEQIFSTMFLFSNLGAIFGPLLISINNTSTYLNYLLIALALLDFILGIFILFTKVNESSSLQHQDTGKLGIIQSIKLIYASKISINLIFIFQMFFWFLVSSCIFLVSFLNKINSEFSSMRGYIFAVEGFTVIFIQLLVLRPQFKEVVRNKVVPFIGMSSFVFGIYLLLLADSAASLVFAGILIGIAEGLIAPFIYNQFSRLIYKNKSHQFFSALLLFELLGDMAGYSFSGWWLGLGHLNYNLALYLFGAIYLIMTVLIWRILIAKQS